MHDLYLWKKAMQVRYAYSFKVRHSYDLILTYKKNKQQCNFESLAIFFVQWVFLQEGGYL